MGRAKKINKKLSLPQLWLTEKFISWNEGHVNPIVRVPRPQGRTESKSITRDEHESEYDLFERCLEFRDRRGVQIWGRRRWQEILKTPVRIVARQPKKQVGPELGVRHYVRKSTGTWAVYWNERLPDGAYKQRSKHYSYGGPYSRYATSEEAKAVAVQTRREKEREWYSTIGTGEERRANYL